MQNGTILLAEDHNVVRQGLRALLRTEPGFEIVGEAVTGREAIKLAETLMPQIVVMDLAMPLLNGMEATRQIALSCSTTRIIVLSAYSDDEHVQQTIAAGAS